MSAARGSRALVLGMAVGALAGCSDGDDQAVSEPTCTDKVVTLTTDLGQVSEPTLPDDGDAGGDGGRVLLHAEMDGVGARRHRGHLPVAPTPDVRRRLVHRERPCRGARRRSAARANALGTGPWSTLGFGLSQNLGDRPVTRAEAESIADVFIDCTDSWKLLLALSVTEGADEIGDESAECVDARLDIDARWTMLVGELDRAYDDPTEPDATPFAELVQPLVEVFEACLTPEEQARLDFS